MERSADGTEPERSTTQSHLRDSANLAAKLTGPTIGHIANAALGMHGQSTALRSLAEVGDVSRRINAGLASVALGMQGQSTALRSLAGLAEDLANQLVAANSTAPLTELRVGVLSSNADRFSDVLAGPVTLEQAVRVITFVLLFSLTLTACFSEPQKVRLMYEILGGLFVLNEISKHLSRWWRN